MTDSLQRTVCQLSDGWHVIWRDQKIAQVFASEAAAQAFVNDCELRFAELQLKLRADTAAFMESPEGKRQLEQAQKESKQRVKEMVAQRLKQRQVNYVCSACGGELVCVQTRPGGWFIGTGLIGCIGMIASLFMNRTRTQWRCSRCGLIRSVTPKSTKQEWILLLLLLVLIVAFGLWLRSCSLLHPFGGFLAGVFLAGVA